MQTNPEICQLKATTKVLLSTEAELQMHFVELGEHMDDPGELQPEGGGAENGADRRERRHLFTGDAFSHRYC